MIDKPGLYDLPEERYHADPCVAPSLSASIAHLLIGETPRHAWTAHPRLGGQPGETSDKMDLGTVSHALLLQGLDVARVVDFPDWRTKAAKEARAAARAERKVPLLAHQFDAVAAMVRAARAQIEAHPEVCDGWEAGAPERTLIWREGTTWCRARVDWIPEHGDAFYDVKTTSGSANPDLWVSLLYQHGNDLRAAFYCRGLRALGLSDNPRYRFVVIETAPPHALSVIELTPAALAMAERKVAAAIDLWRWCLERDLWPGWPARVCYVEPPVGHERRWLDRETRELSARDRGEDIKAMLLDWQRPLATKGATA